MTTLISNAMLPAPFASPDAPAGPVDLTLDGDRLVRVTRHRGAQPASDHTVDATGLIVLPGLIDTHVHLLGTDDMHRFTDAGVTTVAELGTHPDSLVEHLRHLDHVSSILSAGSAASAPGGTQTTLMGFPPESAVTDRTDAERFVRWRIAAGADVIKVIIEDPHSPTPGLSPETLRTLGDVARANGLRTIAHAATVNSFELGLDAGFDILTHSPVDGPLSESIVERMHDQRTICSPTLVMMRGIVAARQGAPGPKLSFDHAIESVRRLHAAGVPLIAGTDANNSPGSPSPVPHGSSLHEELELLVSAGLSAAEAMVAATSTAASALGLGDRGVVASGKRADLILIDGDPTVDVASSRRVRQVWIAGARVR